MFFLMKFRIAGCGWKSLSSGTFSETLMLSHRSRQRSPWRSWKFANKQQWKWPSLDGGKLCSWAPTTRHNSSVVKGIIDMLLSHNEKIILWPLDQWFFSMFDWFLYQYVFLYFCVPHFRTGSERGATANQCINRICQCRPNKSNH